MRKLSNLRSVVTDGLNTIFAYETHSLQPDESTEEMDLGFQRLAIQKFFIPSAIQTFNQLVKRE